MRIFAIKETTGVGGFLGGFGQEFINFPQNADVGTLAQDTLTGLLFQNGPLYLIIYLIAVGFMSLYQLDTEEVEQLPMRCKLRVDEVEIMLRQQVEP